MTYIHCLKLFIVTKTKYKEQKKTNRNNMSKPEALSIRKHNKAFLYIFFIIYCYYLNQLVTFKFHNILIIIFKQTALN